MQSQSVRSQSRIKNSKNKTTNNLHADSANLKAGIQASIQSVNILLTYRILTSFRAVNSTRRSRSAFTSLRFPFNTSTNKVQ